MVQSQTPFQIALQFTLKWEGAGGDPRDLGGTVNYGITQATYDNYLRRKGLGLKPVSQITKAEIENVYYEMYWLPSKADLMVLPLAVVHFDTAVNFSVRASIEFLQETLGGLVVDGGFGAKTQAVLEKANNLETAKRYAQARIDYRYQRVKANSSQEIFLEGWLKRDKDLMQYASQLGGETVTTPKPTQPPVTSTPKPSVNKQDEIQPKLEQAIRLLQEVVELLKKS